MNSNTTATRPKHLEVGERAGTGGGERIRVRMLNPRFRQMLFPSENGRDSAGAAVRSLKCAKIHALTR